MPETGPNADDLRQARALLLEAAIEMFLEDGLPRDRAEERARELVASQPLIQFPDL